MTVLFNFDIRYLHAVVSLEIFLPQFLPRPVLPHMITQKFLADGWIPTTSIQPAYHLADFCAGLAYDTLTDEAGIDKYEMGESAYEYASFHLHSNSITST